MTPRSTKIRILLVDDRGANRYVLSRILQNAGFSVEECATGAQALEVVRTLPDMVVLDVKLPDISGYEVCRYIKTDPITKLIPVLLTSALFAPGQVPPELARVGAGGFLAHPFQPAEVVDKIKDLLVSK